MSYTEPSYASVISYCAEVNMNMFPEDDCTTSTFYTFKTFITLYRIYTGYNLSY